MGIVFIFVFTDFFQITKSGRKIDVQFYGDRTTASIGKSCIFPFNTKINVEKHENRKGYKKAIAEALIEKARSSVESNITEKHAAICDQEVPNGKAKESQAAAKVESASICGRMTRNKSASKANESTQVQTDNHWNHRVTRSQTMLKSKQVVAVNEMDDAKSKSNCEQTNSRREKTKKKISSREIKKKEKFRAPKHAVA